MAEIDDAPSAPSGRGKGRFSRRVGPLPLWGWGLVGAAGLAAIVLLLRRRSGDNKDDSGAFTQTEYVGGGGSGGTGGYYPPGSVIVGGGSNTPKLPNGGTTNPTNPNADCVPSGLPSWMEWPCLNQSPYWLLSGGTGAPKGYKIKPQYVNGPSYDPRDPDVYTPLASVAAPSSGATIDYTIDAGADNSPGTDVLTTDGLDLLGESANALREQSRASWELIGSRGRWVLHA